MNAINLLIDQHRMLEARLQAAVDATQPHARAALLAQIGEQLAAHIASEEEVFYPAVKARRAAHILLDSLEEHGSLQRLLDQLRALSPSTPAFVAKLQIFKEQAEHHHRVEEELLFPQVPKMWDAEQLELLGRQMLRLQQQDPRVGDGLLAAAAARRDAAARPA
jgi:hemerythrin superfamily protein